MIAHNRPQPDFAVGELVRHRRYGYRGVIIALDLECKAPDDWYDANKTQPERYQPWYHVLVHGSSTMTYAAQTSLGPEVSPRPVEHPLVEQFFSAFDGVRYVRNERPFPEGL